MSIQLHKRYIQQSQWTKNLREYLLSSIQLHPKSRVLEIGCGTGVILEDILREHPCHLFGIDLNIDSLQKAVSIVPSVRLYAGDALSLPFFESQFDLVYCHYLLLWVLTPLTIVQEALRVLRPGGSFIAFAEPDYLARIDAPDPLVQLGKLQSESLFRQGARLEIGRLLPGLLTQGGFSQVQFGVSGFQHNSGQIPDWWHSEWEILGEDLSESITNENLISFRELDKSAWLSGSRVLCVPTFYATGIK